MLHIGILTHNESYCIEKCLDNLINNTVNYFIYILDNKSEDGTIDLLKKYERDNIFIFLNDENIGTIKGRNKLYNIIKEKNDKIDYFMFLDADQYVTSGWQKKYFDLIDKGCDLVGAEAWLMNNDFKPIRKCNDNDVCFHYVGCGGCLFINKVIEKIGLFDEIFSPMYYEDPDINFRAIDNNFKIGWSKNSIIHEKHVLLKDKNRKQYFLNSYIKFRNKYKGRRLINISTKN